MSYKQRKVVEIMAEITAIKGQTSYDVSGVKPEIARVCYRLPTENFKDLTSGDYTWTTTGSGYSLQINNEVVRNTAEAYQVYYVHDIQSSKYTTDFEVDINTLVARYNEAVDDIHRLWLFTQKLAFVSDDTTIPIILPQLGEDEIWMRKGDGYVGVTLTDAEGMILDMINKYVTDKKQEISDHVTAELVKADKHILDETLKRIQEITEHTNVMKQEITDLTTVQKKILLDYVNLTLKPMLLAYVNDELKPMLLTYVNTVLKPDLESYTTAKKGELNTATQVHLQTLINKTNELLDLLVAKESELETALSNFTETLKTALNNHTNEKKSEITLHADSESQRVQAEVVAKGEEVKDEINQLIPDNLGLRVEQLENTRVLRSGDVMTGILEMNTPTSTKILLKNSGTVTGDIGTNDSAFIINNPISHQSITMGNDGTITIPSISLVTPTKEFGTGINEIAQGFAKYDRKTDNCNTLSGDGYWTTLANATDAPMSDSCLIFQREYAGYRYQEAYGYYQEGQHWRRFFKIETGGVGVAWTKVLSTGSTDDVILTQGNQNKYGNLSILNSYVAGDGVVIRNAGDIGLTRATSNPNVSFINNNVSGYVGALLNEGCVAFHSYTSGNFFRLYNNGISELYSGATIINSHSGDGYFKFKNTKNVGLDWWTSARLVFENDGKEAIFTGLGNQGLYVFHTAVNDFPNFRMINGATGVAYDVNVVTMNQTIATKFNTSGGTITGAVDVQGAFSANSFYSRGTIVGAGAITSSNNVTAYSDIRLKENLSPLENCLDLIQKLDVYKYNWKETKKEDIGVIAQEVENVFPEFVVEVQDDVKGTIKTVDYAKLATISLKGIKELVGMINELRDDIKHLKEEINGKTQNR